MVLGDGFRVLRDHLGWFCLLAVVAGMCAGSSVNAQGIAERPPLTELGWLQGEGALDDHLVTELVPCLSDAANDEQRRLIEIGRAAFRSPLLFGGLAARKNLSCESCHQGGGANALFFIDGLSDHGGRVDVTNAVFSKTLEDDVFNPVAIPSLYGVNGRTVFGTLSPLSDKAAFVRRVIEDEFDGPPTDPRIFDGLIVYLSHLEESCSKPPRQRRAGRDVMAAAAVVASAENEWRAGQMKSADFLLASVRFDLGRVHERFADDDLKRERDALVSLSRQAQALREMIVSANDTKATRAFRRFAARSEEVREVMDAAHDLSLYNPAKMNALLEALGE